MHILIVSNATVDAPMDYEEDNSEANALLNDPVEELITRGNSSIPSLHITSESSGNLFTFACDPLKYTQLRSAGFIHYCT